MKIKRFFQLMTATVILSSAAIIAPANAEEHAVTSYPMVENIVFDTIGDYLPMRDELAELQQEEPEIYNELIWELYDIAESYNMTRIEAGLETADLYLQIDLKDLEAEWLAMEYLAVQSSQNSPATAEYEALYQAVTEMFELEMQIRDIENEQIWSKLTPEQRSELTTWEAARLSLKDEIIQHELDEYLDADDEFEMYWAETE
ncbi:MAG: hypothetical protein OIF55_08615 [Amphritea sp.]|nr:hypothetical protein [Amphritea sp.]